MRYFLNLNLLITFYFILFSHFFKEIIIYSKVIYKLFYFFNFLTCRPNFISNRADRKKEIKFLFVI